MNETLVSHNPYAAPAATVKDEASPELRPAGRGERLGAYLLDYLFVFLCFIPMFATLPFMARTAEGDRGMLMGVGFAITGLLGLALAVWNCILIHRNGQTLAKLMLGLRVVRCDGSRCGVLRYIFARLLPVAILDGLPLVGPVFFLVDSLMIFRDNRRCLHDEIADTIVVIA